MAPCGYVDGPKKLVKHSDPGELRTTEGYLRARKMTEEQGLIPQAVTGRLRPFTARSSIAKSA